MIVNRLKITGEISYDTPKVVIEEIANAAGIKYDSKNETVSYTNRIISKINKFSEKKIENHDIDSLRTIARYVNAHCKNWKKDVLMKAFFFLNSFEKDRDVPTLKFFGLQTPENIKSVNASVLYKFCKKFNIFTNFFSSLEFMASSLKLYLGIDNPYLQNNIKMKIYDEIRFNNGGEKLVNMMNLIGEDFSIDNKILPQHKKLVYSYEDYMKCADKIEKKFPENTLEAIVLAAVYEKIDITECEDPYTEYYLMKKKPYFPFDKNLIDRMRETELHVDSLRNPYLDTFFNPNLPENMYSRDDLISLYSLEGIVDEDQNRREDYYTSLQLAYLTETFIHGRQGNIENEKNTFLEEFKDLEYDQVVIFGIRGAAHKMRAYTYSELVETFSIYKRFTDPITGDLFTDEAINRLYLLTQKDRRNTESEEVYKERLDLGEEIERIKIYISSKNEYMDEFLQKYDSLNELGKEKVENVLNNLLKSAMYMRNWDGISDYPLTVEATNFDTIKQIIVDDNVTTSLITFEKSLEYLKEYDLHEFILNLPLMQYQKEANIFVTSNDEAEGFTIKDRIRIVRGGESEGLNSCIRLTSNKFAATAYFYMVLIGFRIPFSISEVSQIF